MLHYVLCRFPINSIESNLIFLHTHKYTHCVRCFIPNCTHSSIFKSCLLTLPVFYTRCPMSKPCHSRSHYTLSFRHNLHLVLGKKYY